MKISTHDILTVLRQFGAADDKSIAKQIDQIKQSHPSPINQLIQFRFSRKLFFILIDDTAEDRQDYIMRQIFTVKSDVRGELLKNPITHLETFGLPYKGKDFYLFRTISDKKRLDVLLAEKYPEISRSTWQKYIKNDLVSVNGELARAARQEVGEHDEIVAKIPQATDHSRETLPILYCDDHTIVIDKPAGVLTHSKGALNDEFTVAEFLRRYTEVGLDTDRSGIVHRLDRDTSGVIIGARSTESFELLKKQFSERKAKKTYLAIVDGTLSPKSAKIDIPIGRNPSAPSTFRADPNGKPAQTLYKVLAERDGKSLVELRPQTGRTHQLRVHLKYLRAPIHGDRVYGKPAERMFLHAHKLEITIWPNSRQTFTAPIPSEFLKFFPEVRDL